MPNSMPFKAHKPSPRARIACISIRRGPDVRLRQALKAADYAVSAEEELVDAAIIDLRGKSISPNMAQNMSAVVRTKAPDSPIIFIGDTTMNAETRRSLRFSGEVVIVEDDLSIVIERCRRLLRLRNIAEETGERLKTLTSLNRAVEIPAITAKTKLANVLVAGEIGPWALATINAISAAGNNFTGAISAAQTMRALDINIFDCVIFLPKNESDPLLGLARAMRRHRQYQDIPVLIVVNSFFEVNEFVKRSAREIILFHHVDSDLGARIKVWTRRARLTITMRNFLKKCAGDCVRDSHLGVFSSSFLSRHGASLAVRADQTGRKLSLLAIKLSPNGSSYPLSDGHTTAFKHATRLMQRVIRAEDSLVRVDTNIFLIAMPATVVADALRTGRRLQGVIANTMYRSDADGSPLEIQTHTASIERPAGASIEESVASALAALDRVELRK